VKRILVVAPNWLGDAVMALPAIADFRRALPDASIAVAARPAVAPLFSLVRDVDEVLLMPRRAPYPFSGVDTAILLPNSFHAALVTACSGVPRRWGYRTDCRGMLLTRAVDPPRRGTHQVDAYQQLARRLGFPSGPSVPRIDVPADVRAAGARLLRDAGWNGEAPVVALAPGAAGGRAKRWPAESFAELAVDLAGDHVSVALVGAPADAETAASVVRAIGDRSSPVDLVGRTDVPMLAGVLANCRTLVANDSGAMHVAAAIGVRVTAIFGPTDERQTAARGEVRLPSLGATGADHSIHLTHAVLTRRVWCRPCMLRECPLDHGCMRGITVDAVASAALGNR
jgi:heptosyltransferase-2